MAEAFRLICADLGPDAVILHSQRVKAGGLAGLWRKPQIEIMAADGEWTPAPSGRKLPPDIQRDLAEVKAAIQNLTGQVPGAQRFASAPQLLEVYGHFVGQGLSEPLTQEVLSEVADELTPGALNDPDAVVECARRHLRRRVPAAGPLKLTPGRSQVVFLIGPTGVGKTTTIAKLAAEYAHARRQRVALITADTFRLAAIPQLRAYGDILGVPVEVAYTPEEVRAGIARYSQADLILIDTPGRSPRNAEQLSELKAILDAVPEKQVHLALSASTRDDDLAHMVERFSVAALHSFIITKVDETDHLGAAVNLMHRTRMPVSYLTTGQRVPGDILVASSEQITELLLPMGNHQGTS